MLSLMAIYLVLLPLALDGVKQAPFSKDTQPNQRPLGV
jgi:hypothetical protein